MVDEAPTDDTIPEAPPMAPKKKKRAKPKAAKVAKKTAKPKAAKAKAKAKKNGKAELTDKGLPARPTYDRQIGIRLCNAEYEALAERCRREGHFSLSNAVRASLGFTPLR